MPDVRRPPHTFSLATFSLATSSLLPPASLMTRYTLALLVLSACTPVVAGPFPSYRDYGVSAAAVVHWAATIVDYLPTNEVVSIDPFGNGPHDEPVHALGAADGVTVSLGDLNAAAIAEGQAPGMITVRFDGLLFDGPGSDLAIFENAGRFFDDYNHDFIYAELAFVEVSSDGVHFARFPATSLNVEHDPGATDPDFNQLHVPFARDFAGVNTTNLHHVAGIHPARTGTPFDLSSLSTNLFVEQGVVDLDRIAFVRLVDIPGDGSFLDNAGTPIYDAWPTIYSGGFDLDAVAAIHFVPEPTTAALLALALFSCRLLARSETLSMLNGRS